MNNIAIRLEGIGKQYYIGKKKERYKTFRNTITNAVISPFRKAGKLVRGQATGAAGLDEKIWALDNVSAEIKQGEVVGIIGRNGAGKSTLLKILSRITEPTKGYAEIYGRVGSLLEVGTGFHLELTGRENIYLNGAILGMKRKETDRKFDKIVDFAEVEKFVDTPVKHYSSGMYLRLAFAVAAHLEPEILLIDEVLAVGDARFQKKCLNKMQDVQQSGRTVLFISHSMPTITRLCERVILLDQGKIIADGPSHKVVGIYMNAGYGTAAERRWENIMETPGNEVARLRSVRVKTEDNVTTDVIDIQRPVGIEMEYDVIKPNYALLPHFHFHNEEGVHLFVTIDVDPKWRKQPRPIGRYISTAWIPGNLLSEGMLFVTAALRTLDPPLPQFLERDAVAFQVIDNNDSDTARGDYVGKVRGVIRPLLKWNTQYSSQDK